MRTSVTAGKVHTPRGGSMKCRKCGKAVRRSGLCARHLAAWRGKRPTCSMVGCTRPRRALGMCESHYKRHKRGKERPEPIGEVDTAREHISQRMTVRLTKAQREALEQWAAEQGRTIKRQGRTVAAVGVELRQLVALYLEKNGTPSSPAPKPVPLTTERKGASTRAVVVSVREMQQAKAKAKRAAKRAEVLGNDPFLRGAGGGR
jgi:heterodisulfide reductase subunit A-like polyferredoxin